MRLKNLLSFRLRRNNARAYAHAAGVALTVLVAAAIVLSVHARPDMPDFGALEAGPERKSAFFEFARPLVREANERVRAERARLERIAGDGDPGWLDRRWLRSLAEKYRIGDSEDMSPDELIDALSLRVDAVPVSLALAQAAKESGWGTSRFARNGYNLFGEWCFTPGCGIVPAKRRETATHEVEAFDSPQESVESYVRNINTHDAYREFRRARLAMRKAGRGLSGVELAETLSRYSERRDDYVDEVRRLILANELESSGASGGG